MEVSKAELLKAVGIAEGLEYSQWFFGEALAFDGMADVGAFHGPAQVLNPLGGVLRHWAERVDREGVSTRDLDAPVRSLLALAGWEHAREAEWRGMCRKVCDMILATDTHEGALLHALEGYPNKMVFVDYVYYAGPHLAAVAADSGDSSLFDAAVSQTLAHVKLLNSRNGLLDHVYDPVRHTTNGVAWGRGNGWAMMGLVDTLELVPRNHVGWKAMYAALIQMADTCRAVQDESGHWHTILDDPASPLEPSIAAFFSAALFKAHRLRILGAEYAHTARLAWAAALSNFDRDEGGFETSMTEWPVAAPREYYNRPYGLNPWGQGSFLRAAVEYSRVVAGARS